MYIGWERKIRLQCCREIDDARCPWGDVLMYTQRTTFLKSRSRQQVCGEYSVVAIIIVSIWYCCS